MRKEVMEIAQEELERKQRSFVGKECASQDRIEQQASEFQLHLTNCREKMEELNQRITRQLTLLETSRKFTEMKKGQGDLPPRQVNKPPKFPPFSGTEPTPSGECGIETLLFQIKGARKDVTEQALRTAFFFFFFFFETFYCEFIH